MHFEDVDYSAQVDYLPGFHVADENIKTFLSDLSFESF
jgi:hypothetical protein